MIIKGHLEFSFNNEKHIFRTLTPQDVDMAYVIALREERTFIKNRTDVITIEYQQNYVNNILVSDNDTICGLYSGSKLVGTSGIQNLSSDKSKNRKMKLAVGSTANCTLGIFVLGDSLKGRGYGKALVWASCYLSYCQLGITFFEASMLKHNVPSRKAFLACGFSICAESKIGLNLKLKVDTDLVKPESIKRPIVLDGNK